MPAPKGNQFWKARTTHGRDKLFQTPEILWEACQEYFQWNHDNPLQAAELVKFQGNAKVKHVPKLRAMTIGGLHIFLGINSATWSDYKARKEYSTIITQVELIIRTQKLEGAAADLLNPNIIAREIGLTDKVQHSGDAANPINGSWQIEVVSKAPRPKLEGPANSNAIEESTE